LQKRGIVNLPALVSERDARTMAEYFASHNPPAPNAGIGPTKALAPYSLETVLNCPGLLDLINHPRVLRLAAQYLGCTPTLSSVGVRWSLPGVARPDDIQSFHRGYDDWHSVKLFVYLTNVGPSSGPHIYVRGSHRVAGRLHARPYTETELEAMFGIDCISVMTGLAGTTFMADVYGVHRGAPPTDQPRLMLQAQYSLLPVFAFLYEPISISPVRHIDRYINRLLLRSREPACSSSDDLRLWRRLAHLG